jgi:hypothetical protein
MLNEIPVLDKGYVALYSCAPNFAQLNMWSKTFMRGVKDKKFADMTHVMLQVKCPLFVQLSFPECGLSYLSQRGLSMTEAYVPNVSEVNAMSLEASEAIQADIKQTTDALLLNPKAYQSEHCDLFVSQVISPVSVYNVIMVSGSLTQWKNYISQVGLPAPIEAYRKAIAETLTAEYTGWV